MAKKKAPLLDVQRAHNGLALTVLELAKKVEELEQSTREFSAALALVGKALEQIGTDTSELRRFDQYIADAVKRHEETFHGKLMVDIELKPEAGSVPRP